MNVNWKHTAVEQKGKYLDDHEEGTGGADGNLSGRKNAGDLDDLQNLNERVQGRSDAIAPFWLKGLCSHR